MSFLLLWSLGVFVVIVLIYYLVVIVNLCDYKYTKRTEFYADLLPFRIWVKYFSEKFDSLE